MTTSLKNIKGPINNTTALKGHTEMSPIDKGTATEGEGEKGTVVEGTMVLETTLVRTILPTTHPMATEVICLPTVPLLYRKITHTCMVLRLWGLTDRVDRCILLLQEASGQGTRLLLTGAVLTLHLLHLTHTDLWGPMNITMVILVRTMVVLILLLHRYDFCRFVSYFVFGLF